MSKTIQCFVLAGCVYVLSVPAGAQLLVYRNLSYNIAKTMAETTMESCTAQGLAVSVHVIDRNGDTLVALRGDGARLHTFENSYEKAYTALTFRRQSAEMQAEYAAGNATRMQQADFPGVVAIGGGLPVRVGDDVVGGIGVSGGTGGTNEPCAQAGIDAVASQLQ